MQRKHLMKLYYYEHCPYCIRTLMLVSAKRMDIKKIVLANDDEETPINMIGKKMLPILEKDDGTFMPESLDIVDYLDHLEAPTINRQIKMTEKAEQIFNDLKENYMRLVLPRMPNPLFEEFKTQSARDYFTRKKEKMTELPFETCITNTEQLIEKITPQLEQLSAQLQCERNTLSFEDIQLYPWIYLLQIVKTLKLPSGLQDYLTIKNKQLHDINGLLKLNDK